MEAQFLLLEGEFTIRKDGELLNYTKISDIPAEFDHVIKFMPNMPDEPHDTMDHVEMGNFTEYLKLLQARETK